MTSEKTVAQVLREAAEIIGRGWCQGWYAESESGKFTTSYDSDARRFCIEAAINRARLLAFGRGGSGMAVKSAAIKCAEQVIGVDVHLPDWNDAPDRTQAEVVAKLLEAADLAEREVSHA